MTEKENKYCEIYRFLPVLKNYEWGSLSAIQEITDSSDITGEKVAELWMGSHRNGDGKVVIDSSRQYRLSELITINSKAILGEKCCRMFGCELPFLFKIIAAEKPLSIQVHPSAEQAEKGFEKEEREGIPADSAGRNFKDKNHKPELLYALTDFYMLKGFRKYDEIISNLSIYAPEIAEKEESGAGNGDVRGRIKKFFSSILTADRKTLTSFINRIRNSAESNSGEVSELIKKFYGIYGNDPGVASPLFMNIYRLSPGEAVYIPAGEMHAYISGTGFEIMANSDNVIRGGLTSKHIDPGVLLDIADFRSTGLEIISPFISGNRKTYATPAREFLFSVIELGETDYVPEKSERNIEIFFCLEGNCEVMKGTCKGSSCMSISGFSRGESFIIPACADEYVIRGKATLCMGTVNI